jgi:DsbC/DsbD-like thiol-disulfide interchange protein
MRGRLFACGKSRTALTPLCLVVIIDICYVLPMPIFRRHVAACLLAFISLAVTAPEAAANEASSRWSQGSKSAIRLISGGAGKDGSLKAGIEITLAKGFKTYWRSPGDSGVPPRFDWSASENVGSITVGWPAPERFGDDREFSVGYMSDVILPLGVRPTNPDKPVKLVLKLDYAVCEKICIPAAGEAELVLGKEPTTETARIAAYKALVPLHQAKTAGDGAPGVAEVTALHGPNGRISLQVVANRADKAAPGDIFVEGPDNWAFGRPDFKPAPDNRLVAVIEVTDKPKSVTGPVPLVITLTGAGPATETRLDLDMSPARP